jgi:hypothetical protein
MQLQPGSDVKQFMEKKIKSSHTILWIGTPQLKARIRFNNDNTPFTNVAIEFCHIRDKDTTFSKQTQLLWSIQSLWFDGKSVLEAFPDEYKNLNTVFHDFTQEQEYYIQLP